MEASPMKTLRIGDWRVHPTSGRISRNGESAQLEVRTLRLLLHLAEHAGEVVSIDDLLNHVWAGVIVSPDSVYQAIASLRRQLGDDPKEPAYIATVPRLGYRMVAKVEAWEDPAIALSASDKQRSIRNSRVVWLCIAICVVLTAAYFFLNDRNIRKERGASVVPQAQRTLAVLPFLDLTEKMSHEIFADGMTEELIDRLSTLPGFRVSAPRTSFQLKGKKMPIGEVGKTLGVDYVVDGSIRQSNEVMRVAVRLVRADNGYVVWSETYERSWGDLLKAQKEIAGAVANALRAALGRAV
jgi:transcriptional activator of cad operon